jgi:ABC-type amino acid transport substrate-binding protein
MLTVFISLAVVSEPSDRRIVIGIAGVDFTPTIVTREIMTEAYARIGYRAEFTAFPPDRMIASLDSGLIDALLIAEASLEKDLPGSVRIETPVWIDELTVFSRRHITVGGWESLRPFRIGYIAGMLIIKEKLKDGFTVFPAQDPAQLFRMLDANRTDVVVTSRSIGELMIRRLDLKGIRSVGGTFGVVPNYHFLAGKNAELAPRLSAALEEMEKSGQIAEITRRTLDRLFSR